MDVRSLVEGSLGQRAVPKKQVVRGKTGRPSQEHPAGNLTPAGKARRLASARDGPRFQLGSSLSRLDARRTEMLVIRKSSNIQGGIRDVSGGSRMANASAGFGHSDRPALS